MKIKFVTAGMAILIVILCLTSCAGIGDGALFDNVQLNSKDTEAAETAKTGEYAALLTDIRKCTVMAYGEYGEIFARAAKNGAEAQAIYDLIKNGEIDAESFTEKKDKKNYLYVTFFGENEKNEYFYVWRDSAVARQFSTSDFSSGYLKIGYISGLYESIADACEIVAPEVSVRKDSCVMNIYNSEGQSTGIARPDAELQKDLRSLFDSAEYEEGFSANGTYIHVLFTDQAGMNETYWVYSNDSVLHSTTFSSGRARLGKLEGIFKSLQGIMNEANQYKRLESEKAGYSVSDLIIHGEASADFTLTTFSYQFDCIGIVRIMDMNDGSALYGFYFDCDTKERIDEIYSELMSFGGIKTVSYNYIVTPD